MKQIKKLPEPANFREWKSKANENWQPNWDNFSNPEKATVHQNLVKEQGYICCYCGKRIAKLEDSHIEHLKPRKNYADLALDYDNLLASCQKESKDKNGQPIPPPIPVHCGHKKADWYDENLMVSPLEPNCESLFYYTEDGQMLAKKDHPDELMAKTTIDKLGLNIDKLKELRKNAIEGFLEGFDDLTDLDKQKIIYNLEDPEQGQYQEFCTAILFVFKSFL